ncbi:hypothetical protein GEOBRER4_n0477 [Citrifermentans bremense]|uniref:Uncharacterized protein n=1 Tax=Citrifermentans bremense TaxID=60035 RepID=A0A7R7FS09_9BACT|nr:hypothetical protein GEOBRER4_n0477 [Citrifermentans bremense]
MILARRPLPPARQRFSAAHSSYRHPLPCNPPFSSRPIFLAPGNHPDKAGSNRSSQRTPSIANRLSLGIIICVKINDY